MWQFLKHMCCDSFLLVHAQGKKTKAQKVATTKGDRARGTGELLFREGIRGRSSG